jgi:hypothetical protein
MYTHCKNKHNLTVHTCITVFDTTSEDGSKVTRQVIIFRKFLQNLVYDVCVKQRLYLMDS